MRYITNEEEIRTALMKSGGYMNTQQKKAAMIGISQATISRLESGQKKFSELKLQEYLKICEYLERAPFEFMEREKV